MKWSIKSKLIASNIYKLMKDRRPIHFRMNSLHTSNCWVLTLVCTHLWEWRSRGWADFARTWSLEVWCWMFRLTALLRGLVTGFFGRTWVRPDKPGTWGKFERVSSLFTHHLDLSFMSLLYSRSLKWDRRCSCIVNRTHLKKKASSSSLYSGLITYTLAQLKLPLDDMESFLI